MKTTSSGLISKRMLRLLACTCAFCFIATAASSEELRICPECGREGAADAEACESCGAKYAPPAASSVSDSDDGKKKTEEATSSIAAVKKDVAEARRVLDANPALALVIYRNAQALLAADGLTFNAKAAKILVEELKTARSRFNSDVNPVNRKAALAKARREAEDYFRSVGRTPMGRVWVPIDWPGTLMPRAIAAVRSSLQPDCSQCGGEGGVPCKTCGGAGRVPCNGTGCKNGWVMRKPTNSLTPSTDLTIREKCPVCKGTAFVGCKACASRGAIACKKCGGSGEAAICSGCQGSGLEPCTECRKKPKGSECVLCRGQGEMLCRKCGGDGRVAK